MAELMAGEEAVLIETLWNVKLYPAKLIRLNL